MTPGYEKAQLAIELREALGLPGVYRSLAEAQFGRISVELLRAAVGGARALRDELRTTRQLLRESAGREVSTAAELDSVREDRAALEHTIETYDRDNGGRATEAD